MAKSKSPQKGFLQKMTKGQKISLFLVILAVIALPLVIFASQIQTRLNPRASIGQQMIERPCVPTIKTVTNRVSCKEGSNIFKGYSFICNDGTNKVNSIMTTTCQTETKLRESATKKCAAICASRPSPTPTTCKAGVSSETPGASCSSKEIGNGFMTLKYQCVGNSTWYTASLKVCSSIYDLKAQAATYCATHSKCPTPTPTPACKYYDTVCSQEYAPVCGTNGKVYSNSCEAQRNCVEVKCDGKCPCPTPTPTACKTGVDKTFPGASCSSKEIGQGIMTLKYTCGGNKNMYTATLNRCTSINALMEIANKYCSTNSKCSETPISTTPTPMVQRPKATPAIGVN